MQSRSLSCHMRLATVPQQGSRFPLVGRHKNAPSLLLTFSSNTAQDGDRYSLSASRMNADNTCKFSTIGFIPASEHLHQRKNSLHTHISKKHAFHLILLGCWRMAPPQLIFWMQRWNPRGWGKTGRWRCSKCTHCETYEFSPWSDLDPPGSLTGSWLQKRFPNILSYCQQQGVRRGILVEIEIAGAL